MYLGHIDKSKERNHLYKHKKLMIALMLQSCQDYFSISDCMLNISLNMKSWNLSRLFLVREYLNRLICLEDIISQCKIERNNIKVHNNTSGVVSTWSRILHKNG